MIKKSLVLQLLGGVARMEMGRTRGDIHILLETLVLPNHRFCLSWAVYPRGRFTTGGGTSVAGLTAAAVRDAFNDGRFSLK